MANDVSYVVSKSYISDILFDSLYMGNCYIDIPTAICSWDTNHYHHYPKNISFQNFFRNFEVLASEFQEIFILFHMHSDD